DRRLDGFLRILPPAVDGDQGWARARRSFRRRRRGLRADLLRGGLLDSRASHGTAREIPARPINPILPLAHIEPGPSFAAPFACRDGGFVHVQRVSRFPNEEFRSCASRRFPYGR